MAVVFQTLISPFFQKLSFRKCYKLFLKRFIAAGKYFKISYLTKYQLIFIILFNKFIKCILSNIQTRQTNDFPIKNLIIEIFEILTFQTFVWITFSKVSKFEIFRWGVKYSFPWNVSGSGERKFRGEKNFKILFFSIEKRGNFSNF